MFSAATGGKSVCASACGSIWSMVSCQSPAAARERSVDVDLAGRRAAFARAQLISNGATVSESRPTRPPLPIGPGASPRPAFPAFADRLGVAADVDVANAIDAVLYRVGRVFVFFLHRLEEWPEERQRKETPRNVSERGFDLDLLLFLARGVTNRETDRQAHDERAENRRHGIFAQK